MLVALSYDNAQQELTTGGCLPEHDSAGALSSSFLILCPMHNLITSHCVTLAGSKVGSGSHVSLIYYISHTTGRLLMVLNHGFYHIILCLETFFTISSYEFQFPLTFKVLKMLILSQAYATQMHCPLLSKPFITQDSH